MATDSMYDHATDCTDDRCENGWIIVNPDWPKGDDVYRERCPFWEGDPNA